MPYCYAFLHATGLLLAALGLAAPAAAQQVWGLPEPLAAPAAADSVFIADDDPALDVYHYGYEGAFAFTLETTRYVGEVDAEGYLVDADALIAAGLIPEYVPLRIHSGDVGKDDYHYVYFNGDKLGRMDRQDQPYQWWVTTFWVDVRTIKFPQKGDSGGLPAKAATAALVPAQNEVYVDLNVYGYYDEGFRVDWASLGPIHAQNPVLLVHGWHGDMGIWESVWKPELDQVSEELWSFVEPVDLSPVAAPSARAQELAAAADRVKQAFGADRVNIVAHSQGGLDARYYIGGGYDVGRPAGPGDDVDVLVMLGTPNAGTQLAKTGTAVRIVADRTPYLRNLFRDNEFGEYFDPAEVSRLNDNTTRGKNTGYVSIAGKFSPGLMSWLYAPIENNLYTAWLMAGMMSGKGTPQIDGVVPVHSVHTIPYFKYNITASSKEYEVGDGAAHTRLYKSTVIFKCAAPYVFDAIEEHCPIPVQDSQGSQMIAAAEQGTDLYASAAPSPVPLRPFTMNKLATQSSGGADGFAQAGPLVEDTLDYGVVQSHSLEVGLADTVSFLIGSEYTFDAALIAPDGERFELNPDFRHSTAECHGIYGGNSFYEGQLGGGSDVYGDSFFFGCIIPDPPPGTWTFEADGGSLPPGSSTEYSVGAFLRSPTTLEASTDGYDYDYPNGDPIPVYATPRHNGQPLLDATVTAKVLRGSDSAVLGALTLRDDGTGGDTVAGDGVYTAIFAGTTEPIRLGFAVVARGTAGGYAFERGADASAAVAHSRSTLTGSFTERPEDADGDGLYENLYVDVEISIDRPGRYAVRGSLVTPLGQPIANSNYADTLPLGTHTVTLLFPGRRIYASHEDGPYVLENVQLIEEEGGFRYPDVIRGTAYETAPYRYTDFDRPDLDPHGDPEERTPDDDGNGYHDGLEFDLQIDALTPGPYQLTGHLADTAGTLIQRADAVVTLAAGRNTVTLAFDGDRIRAHGVDGPYRLRDLTLAGAGHLFRRDVATSQPYRADAFGTPPEVSADVRFFLEGPYVAADSAMRTVLRDDGWLPLDQPYADAFFDGTPMDYDAPVRVDSFPPGTVDWVLIELRAGLAPSTAVGTTLGLLQSDGTVQAVDADAPPRLVGVEPGAYHVVVRHRNHLPALSAAAVDFSSGIGTYDFTTAMSTAYKSYALSDLGNAYGLVSADASGNGQVQNSDRFFYWEPNVGRSGYLAGDFDLNSHVQDSDRFLQWWPNVGRGTEIDSDTFGSPSQMVAAAAQTEALALEGNYPNPFNPVTTIRYHLPEAMPVRLEVFDVLGRRVALLAEGVQAGGAHEARFDARGLASGTYLYRLTAGGRTEARRMLLHR